MTRSARRYGSSARAGSCARVGQCHQFVADFDQPRRHRQLFLQRGDFAEVVCERGVRRPRSGQPDDVGGDVRVAVAVAADPRPGPQDRLLEQVRVRPAGLQRGAYFGVHLRDDLEEGGRVIAQTGFDLVLNLQPGQPDQRGLPQSQNVAAQFGLDVAAIGGVRVAVQAQPHQLGDAVLGVEDRAATGFGGMRGDHRRHQRTGQRLGHGRGVEIGRVELEVGGGQAAVLRRLTRSRREWRAGAHGGCLRRRWRATRNE